MRQIQSNNSGFGLVPLLLAILVIGVVSFTGWFVFDKNNTKNNAGTSPTITQQVTDKPSNSQQEQPTSPTFLTISEWGVKVLLSNKISDAYYVKNVGSLDADGQPGSILLSLKSLDNTGCGADKFNNGDVGAIALIGRTSLDQTDPISGEPLTKKYPNGTVIGNYYYFFQDRTRDLNCTSQANLRTISTAFATAAKSITVN